MSAPAKGVVLQRTLDERSPSRRFDAQALQQEIEAIVRAVAPAKVITAVRRRGPLVDVAVLTARGEKGGAAQAAPAAAPASAAVSTWRAPSW